MISLIKISNLLTASLFVLVSISLSCSDPLSFSPFEAKVRKEHRHTTEKNLEKIRRLDFGNETFKVALIADTHYHFNALFDAIRDMRRKGDFSFIIVVGDITENGLLKEFEVFHSIMATAGIPYLAVIGNHDYLSNGGGVYQEMYGAFNYSFIFNNVKFVVWDNVIWESRKEADYEWLEQALDRRSGDGDSNKSYDHIIPLSHIPPSDAQFESHKDRFHGLLKRNGITLSVHGHKHEFSLRALFQDDIQFVTVGSPQHRSYTELYINGKDIQVRKIEY